MPLGSTAIHSAKLNIGCWNIKHAEIKRELEIAQLLKNENLGILFLTETDAKSLASKKDFQVQDYKTIFQTRTNPDDNLRIMCLVNNEILDNIFC